MLFVECSVACLMKHARLKRMSTNWKNIATPLEQLRPHYDIIVIGSGMGGMSAAIALQKSGKNVLLLEQHYVPGGLTHTFKRKNFHWDVGVHCLGDFGKDTSTGRALDFLTDSDLPKLQSMGDAYEKYIFEDGTTFDVPSNLDHYRELLTKNFPEDKTAIQEYFKLIDQASRQGAFVFSKRVLPKLASAFIPNRLHSFWNETTETVLNRLTKNKKLQKILTGQWGYNASPPSESSFGIHAAIVNHYLKGGFYPVGTAENFAEKMITNFKKHGGEFCLRAEVKKILADHKKVIGVELSDGITISAGKVISSIGAKKTLELTPAELTPPEWKKRINALKDCPAYFCLYIGYECEKPETLGISKANHWFYENDPSTTWRDPEQTPPVMYVSFPSLKDPLHTSSAHTAELITFTDYDLFEKWGDTRRGKRTPDYMEFKKVFEEKLLSQFKKRFPSLSDKITHFELATPLSMEFFTKSHHGAIYGLASTVDRYLTSDLRPKTPIQGLYLTGQDVLTPGVVGAMTSGLLTAGTIDSKILRYL